MISKFGVSCASPADALTALAIDVVSFVQVELSLLHPETLVEVIPIARRLQKTVITRQCFASGLLTWPPGDSRFASQPLGRLADLDRCRRAAEELSLPLGHAALGFTMGTAGIATTLLGAHTVSQLMENLRWANKELSADGYGALRAAAFQP